MRIAIIHSRYVKPTEQFDTGTNGNNDAHSAYDAYYANACSRVKANIAHTTRMMREAGAAGADLVVTNEDFGSIVNYLRDMQYPTCFGNLVADFEDRLLEEICAIAKEFNMYIAANEFETHGGNIYNTSKLIGRSGEVVGRYRKVHLPSGERLVVKPGWEYGVFETDIGNIGFAICYDLLFPEHCRILALNGADMIIHQSQGWFPGGLNERVLGEPYIKVRATENRVYMVVAKNEQGDGGMSCIIDNHGSLLASKSGACNSLLMADIEPDFNAIDEYDYDNYFAGLRSLRARHLLHREPSTYARLLESDPTFASELLSTEKLCTYEEWVDKLKALDAMTDKERSKFHW